MAGSCGMDKSIEERHNDKAHQHSERKILGYFPDDGVQAAVKETQQVDENLSYCIDVTFPMATLVWR